MCDDRDETLLLMRVLLFLPVVLSGEEDEVAWLEIVGAFHSDRQGVELESLVPSTQHEPKVLAKVVDALAHESTAVLCEQNHRTAGAKKRVESELDDANWGGVGGREEKGGGFSSPGRTGRLLVVFLPPRILRKRTPCRRPERETVFRKAPQDTVLPVPRTSYEGGT